MAKGTSDGSPTMREERPDPLVSNRSDRDVHIVEVDGAFRVRPAVAAVKGGVTRTGAKREVSFRNVTEHDVTVTFPPGIVTPPEDSSKTLLPFQPYSFKLEDVETRPKVVTYLVVVTKGDELIVATGESGPRLIIDP